MRSRQRSLTLVFVVAVLLWPGVPCAGTDVPSERRGRALDAQAGRTAATSPGQWTWAGGPNRVAEAERLGVYGTKGVAAPGNSPGAREGASLWIDATGNLWLFGGRGDTAKGAECVLNDLWKWDGTSWAWMSGTGTCNAYGVYGQRGVTAPGNSPGARQDASTWKDGSGNLWLFGGVGHPSVAYEGETYTDRLSDLWKWDGTNWTWMGGPDSASQPGSYGTKGVAASSNWPGARSDAAAWRDASGGFWLLGGLGLGASASPAGRLNDVWKWDGSTWTWIGGSDQQYAHGLYGTKGVADPSNQPGARYGATAALRPDGRVLLFGGVGDAESDTGLLNDLWSWDGSQWTWLSGAKFADQEGEYGTKGVPGAANRPGAREAAASWADAAGKFFLLGGGRQRGFDDWSAWNDLWMWDGTNWTWVGGASTPNPIGVYGTKGLPAAGNEPGGRLGHMAGQQASGAVLVFGGVGSSATGRIGTLNDLWQWDGAQWAWVSGSTGESQAGVYGVKGVASAANRPGARCGAVTWSTANGETWLFGGYGYSARGLGHLNDLWRFDGTAWTWVSGSDLEGQAGVYGSKGVAASTNVPGARAFAVSWADAAGNLWLFGGEEDQAQTALRNDLWKWDGSSWTWVSGSDAPGDPGVYGTKGVPADSNVPPCRSDASSFTDGAGNLWLFGGDGWPISPGSNLNDLWRWDGQRWTWISGANGSDVEGYFGTRGVAAPANVPPGRSAAASWVDGSGGFWLFGGAGSSTVGLRNDLWRWDGTYWTWMSGAVGGYASGVYGTLGVSAPENEPAARTGASTWTDATGHRWLFGGSGYGGDLNDLWRWDGSAWTWMGGSASPYQAGVYGESGVPAPSNVPGSRWLGGASTDSLGRFRLLGGMGEDSIGARGLLSDLWVYEPPACSPPVATISAPDSIPGWTGQHSASVPDAGAGATYEWTLAGGSIVSGQTTPTITFEVAPGAMEVVLRVLVSRADCAGTFERSIPVGLYHRLDVVRNGYGNVQLEIGGVPESCTLECVAVVAHGASVSLAASPDPGSRFVGWLGEGCTGTGSCTVTMDEAKTVSATFFPSESTGFYPVTPCRAVDTRNAAGAYGAPPLEAGATRSFTIGGQCGVPADASAVALNVTVTAPTEAGSLTLLPGTGPAPETTTIHFAAGRTRANNVTMGLAEGVLSVLDRQTGGTVELILDVAGYYR